MEKQCCHKWRLKNLIKKLKKENKIKYNQKEECCQLPMEKHEKFSELLDSKRWDYESGFSITFFFLVFNNFFNFFNFLRNEEMKKKIERRKNFIENYLVKNRNLLAKPVESTEIKEEYYAEREEEDMKSLEKHNEVFIENFNWFLLNI